MIIAKIGIVLNFIGTVLNLFIIGLGNAHPVNYLAAIVCFIGLVQMVYLVNFHGK